MKNSSNILVDKTEEHIERVHQNGMRMSRRYSGVTNFRQKQTS